MITASKKRGMRRLVYAMSVIFPLLLGGAMIVSLRPFPSVLAPAGSAREKRQVVDRSGRALSYTFATRFNVSDERPLHEIPALLRVAFIEAEDRRFFDHAGVDWLARAHAVWQNARALRVVRGASTISEQVVRMLHPRPRSLWSRCIESIEAYQLERRFSKGEILEFYLNQVPFAANRRGVVQAARYFWDRDLTTLNEREQLALAVMVRAPARLDLFTNPHGVDRGIQELADHMRSRELISQESREAIEQARLTVGRGSITTRADHFVRYVQSVVSAGSERIVRSTIDSRLQRRVQDILERRVAELVSKSVSDGAAIVVDNRSAEVLAWVNAGEFGAEQGSQIDAVVTPRQPGSALKPFVYALALSEGWTAATVLSDAPLAEPVGAGMHAYRNYSRIHYGDISLRESLGNSLNIPAILTVRRTGTRQFLEFLRSAGFASLSKPADFYGEGLALGNGEVTLFELTQAYTALAHRGIWRPLRVTRARDDFGRQDERRVLISPEVSSIIGHILSDPLARRREFGSDGLFRFPVQTAIKTGTSTDYRDAWALGYTEHHTVGVWLGNLNRSSMTEISGARGPALALRSIFAELHRFGETRPLYLAPTLVHRDVCSLSGELPGDSCPRVEEVFVPGSEPGRKCAMRHESSQRDNHSVRENGEQSFRVSMPTPGLNIARDPRIPDSLEALPLELEGGDGVDRVRWLVDEKEVGATDKAPHRYLWALTEGHHTVRAEVFWVGSKVPFKTQSVGFWVR